MTSLFPPRESLVVTSRLGTGNSRSFFFTVHSHGRTGGEIEIGGETGEGKMEIGKGELGVAVG